MRTATFLLLASTSALAADDFDTIRAATDLGSVLAAEAPCGLTYDQAAIEAYIDGLGIEANMGFVSTLSMMTQGAEFNQRDLSESARTAHCRAVTLTARHYGFID